MGPMDIAGSRPARAVTGAILAAYYVVGLAALPGHAGARDSDKDGMPNRWEVNQGLDAHDANAHGNPDHDGLKNIREFRNHSEPKDEDTDNDGIDDGDEVDEFESDVDDADSNDDGDEDGDEGGSRDGVDNEDEDDSAERCKSDDDDRDADGVADEDENDFGTGVRDADSDDDGIEDGNEDADDDELDDEDEDDDGDDRCDDDGEDADDIFATIVSFDGGTGLLTMESTEGVDVTGTITDETEIEWDSSGHGSGGEASTADLAPGAGVTDLDFEDDSAEEEAGEPVPGAIEEIELAR